MNNTQSGNSKPQSSVTIIRKSNIAYDNPVVSDWSRVRNQDLRFYRK